jgi:hypothetical protein
LAPVIEPGIQQEAPLEEQEKRGERMVEDETG